MPKPTSAPPIINDLYCLSVGALKVQGLFHRENPPAINITWRSNITQQASCCVRVRVNSKGLNHNIRLTYSLGSKQYDYCIPLIIKLSNLGKGMMYYFQCPETKRNCRKLFFLCDREDEHFVGRHAVMKVGGIYKSELRNRKLSSPTKFHDQVISLVKIIRQGWKRNFKAEYRGVPTLRKLRINRAWDRLRRMGFKDYASLCEYMDWDLSGIGR